MEKVTSSWLQGFNTSNENFVKNVCDDVIFLAHEEPIIKGKQGEIIYAMAKITEGIRIIYLRE